MQKNLATGHATNVVILITLISCIQSYGDHYNPSKETIKLPALQKMLKECENVIALITNLEVANKNAIDDRDQAYQLFNMLLTSINNIIKASDTSKDVREHVSTLIRLIRAGKLSTRRAATPIADPQMEAEETKVVILHKMGYEVRLQNFDKLIQYLASVPAYTPNEPELTVKGLTACHDDLESKNQAVTNADIQLTQARISRTENFYSPSTGLAYAGNEARSYIKAIFGTKSTEYKQVAKLQFKIYKN
jgi:hypothetical protein